MSRIYQLALKHEAEKRGIKANIQMSSEEDNTDDGVSVSRKSFTPYKTPPKTKESYSHQNA